MKYKLINPNYYPFSSVAEVVLVNRGIMDPWKYLNLTDEVIYPYSHLSNIEEAKQCLLTHIEKGDRIGIVVDCDPDGYTAAAILYQYLSKNYGKSQLEYYLHAGKQHGLSDIVVPDSVKLLIVPDASTNDVDECKALVKRGISVIVLDHHEKEKDNPYAIIVNPQICDYPNKSLSGCGVVKKFLECLDDEWWTDSSEFEDLVSLSIIADSMSIKEYENKRLVDKGLLNITNKLLMALIEKQSYSIGGIVSINNIAFYIVPLLNALIRSGSHEEKDLMFRAFCETDEVFLYSKPGKKEVTDENIYERVARLAGNLKAKQDREVKKAMEILRNQIAEKHLDDNKIIFCGADDVDWNYTGLVAIKIANEYNRPCLLLRKNKNGLYSGSARNFSNAIEDLKGYLDGLGLFESLQGHSGAFGVSIEKGKIKPAIQKINEDLKDVDMEFVYMVDFEIDIADLNYEFIREMIRLSSCYGQGIEESLICIKNIKVNTNDIELMGKDNDTWKVSFNDGEYVLIRFKAGQDDEVLKLKNEDWGGVDIELQIIGKVGMNNYNGISTPQIIIQNYEIVK